MSLLYSINDHYPNKNFEFHLDENVISASSAFHTHSYKYSPLKTTIDNSTVTLYEQAEILQNNNGLCVNTYKGKLSAAAVTDEENFRLSTIILNNYGDYTDDTELSVGSFFKYISPAYTTLDEIYLKQNNYILIIGDGSSNLITIKDICENTIRLIDTNSDLHIKFDFLVLMNDYQSSTHSVAYSVKNSNVELDRKSNVNHTHKCISQFYTTTQTTGPHRISLGISGQNGQLIVDRNTNTIKIKYDSPVVEDIKYIENTNEYSNDFLLEFTTEDDINITEDNVGILQFKENKYA